MPMTFGGHDEDNGRRMVIGVDGAPGSRAALAWAVSEGRRRGGQLQVVHAWHDPNVSVGWVPVPVAELEEAGLDLLGEALDAAIGMGPELTISGKLCRGDAGECLSELSEGADLLVIGAHRLGGLGSVLRSSVGEGCTHRSSCPVVVVRPPRADAGDAAGETAISDVGAVVVGVDGSPGANEALRWAVAEARLRGCALHLVHAWHHPPSVSFAPGPPADWAESAGAVLARSIERARSMGPDLAVTGTVTEKDATTALVEESSGAALLVVGSRRRGGLSGLLLGSVSRGCLRRASGTVVVVPRNVAHRRPAAAREKSAAGQAGI
jgi:nucleotide-binding universal stress UspA family protein